MTRPRRGFIMVLALSLMFVMIILALGLAQMQQAHTGFTLLTEAQGRATEAAEDEFSHWQGILNGDESSTVLGVPAVPAAGGDAALFSGPSGLEIPLSGTFNGGPGTSLFRPLPANPGFAPSDGYGDALSGQFPVPTRHVLTVVQAAIPSQPVATYFSVYSPNFTFGVVSVQGNISLLEARSTSDAATPGFRVGNDDQTTGLPVTLFANGNVTVSGFLNGEAVSNRGTVTLGGVTPGPAGVGAGGLAVVGGPAVVIPADFSAALSAAETAVSSGLISLGPQIDAVHASLTLGGFPAPLVVSPLGTATTEFNVGGSFGLPPNNLNIRIPFSTVIAADLLIPDRGVLEIDGNLTVQGRIFLGSQSTLVVTNGGSLTAGQIIMTFVPPADQTAISAAVLVDGSVALQQGMDHLTGVSLSRVQNFSPNPQNPFPQTVIQNQVVVPNPEFTLFQNAADQASVQANTSLGAFLGNVVASQDSGNDANGVLLLAKTGSIKVAGTRAAGLLVAVQGAVDLTGLGRLVGAVWANGNVDGPQTQYRYYPYFTHAFLHTSAADLGLPATRYHRTAYGRVLP